MKYEMKTANFGDKYWKEGNEYAENSVLYSLYGFIKADRDSKNTFQINRNGAYTTFDITAEQTDLPVVRYLMPIPREAITRSEGKLKNYYGY